MIILIIGNSDHNMRKKVSIFEDVSKKKKTALKQIYISTVLILLISIMSLVNLSLDSFALWYETNNQPNDNLISTGCFDISFYDLNNNESTSISLLNSYPISEKNGVKLKPYTFTLKNICNTTGQYRIVLSKLSNSDLNVNNMRYTFNKVGGALIVNPIPSESNTALDKNTLAIINEKNSPNYITDNYVLEEGYIRPGEEFSYELRIWLDENAGNEEMNKTFEAVVSISSIATN